MSTLERREAAKANQRAAAFARFHLLGDAEAMQLVLSESGESDYAHLAFVTALASIAGTVATRSMGRDGALDYLQNLAAQSAVLSEAADIDRFFD